MTTRLCRTGRLYEKYTQTIFPTIQAANSAEPAKSSKMTTSADRTRTLTFQRGLFHSRNHSVHKSRYVAQHIFSMCQIQT
jgi:hypothetical protein